MRTDAQVRTRMIEQHLPLVHSIARRYAGGPEPFDDLVQAGSEGLVKAVDRFDPARGGTFAALAAPSIEGEIRHHLRDRAALVRVPRRLRELGTEVRRAEDEITAQAGRPPGVRDLARALGVSEAAVGEALLARAAGAGAPLEDADAAQSDERGTDRVALAQAWGTLRARDRELLELRYRDDLSQAEIARRVGRSQGQVSRSLAAALTRLRAGMGVVAEPVRAAYSAPEMDAPSDRPEPARSGRFLVRMPQSLHDDLAREAEREGVSLNTMITAMLAAGVRWRDTGEGDGPAPASPRTSRILAANLVVVGVVAIVAMVLLAVAVANA